MPEEKSKIVFGIIFIVFSILVLYVSAVIVAIIQDVSVMTVIHNWRSWVLGFLKILID